MNFSLRMGTALVVAALVVTGCSGLPTDGPRTRAIIAATPELRLQELTLETLPNQVATFASAIELGTAPTETPDRFVVAPGDILTIALFEGMPDGVFATPAAGGSVFEEVPVREDGTITLPYVGTLPAAGRDVSDIRRDILSRVRNFATRPDAVIQISSRNRGSVSVAGAVRTPARTAIGAEILTVQDALSRAGAPFDAPYTAEVTIRQASGVSRASLAQILTGPPLPLTGNTDLIVMVRPAVFHALGALRRQGTLPLTRANISLLNALSDAAGLDPLRANARGVFVFRAADAADPDQRPMIYQLDMRRPDAFAVAQQFMILPDDTLYVTEAPVAQWTKVLSAIQGTVSVGASAATLERLSSGS